MQPQQGKKKKRTKNPIKGSYQRIKKAVKVSFAPVQDDYRWEELQEIERDRREILLRVDDPVWKTLLRYDGTVMQILIADPLFWFTVLLYVGIRILAEYDLLPPSLHDFPVDSITVLGGFLSFFLVFWVNQSNSRFFGLYGHSMACKGRIFDAASLAVTCLPYAQASRLVRYMNAAHAAGYVGLSEVYPSSNYFNYVNKQMGLLTPQERDRLDTIDLDKGGSCSREIIIWCMNEVAAAERQGIIGERLAIRFRDEILALRGAIGALFNAKDLPIPFFYVHFICILTTLYLPLFAVTASIQAGTGADANWIAGLVRGLIVVLQAIFVIGLRILGQKLNDPYGDDLIDLSVMHFVHFTWQMSNRILCAHFPEEADPVIEDALKREREHLGAAWERPKGQATGGSSVVSSDIGLSFTASDASGDVEARLSQIDSRIILNPPMATATIGGGCLHSSTADASPRVSFNPAIRESDLKTVGWEE